MKTVPHRYNTNNTTYAAVYEGEVAVILNKEEIKQFIMESCKFAAVLSHTSKEDALKLLMFQIAEALVRSTNHIVLSGSCSPTDRSVFGVAVFPKK